MLWLKLALWLSVFASVYHIALYPLLLALINKYRGDFSSSGNDLCSKDELLLYPSITILCPAYNEEKVIEEKIQSFLALDYPKDKIKMLVLSDDSTDRTNEIVNRFTDQNIELIIQKPRKGKQSAHNMVLDQLDTDLILSTDANSIFAPDSVKILVKEIMSDPRIGMASGELKLISSSGKDSGEGLYWRYESFVKDMDSRFHSIIVANGSLFLIRRELFVQIPPDSGDDFERVLYLLSKGYLAKHVSKATVYEEVTEHAVEELHRKIRIISQEWAALKRYRQLLNPFQYPRISFLLISHKLVRWMFFLFAGFILIASSLFYHQPFYKVLFDLQVLFYAIGFVGLIAQSKRKHIPGTGIPAYIITMCYASLIAFINFLMNKKSGVWNPIRK